MEQNKISMHMSVPIPIPIPAPDVVCVDHIIHKTHLENATRARAMLKLNPSEGHDQLDFVASLLRLHRS